MTDNPVVMAVFLVSGMFLSAAPVQVLGSDTTVGIDLMDNGWVEFMAANHNRRRCHCKQPQIQHSQHSQTHSPNSQHSQTRSPNSQHSQDSRQSRKSHRQREWMITGSLMFEDKKG